MSFTCSGYKAVLIRNKFLPRGFFGNIFKYYIFAIYTLSDCRNVTCTNLRLCKGKEELFIVNYYSVNL